jgi:hypothetical protein
VTVGERVVHVLGDASSLDQPLGPQQAQLLRDGGQRDVRRLGELGHAPLAVGEPDQELEAREIARRAEEAGRALVGLFAHAGLDRRARRVLGRLAGRDVGGLSARLHRLVARCKTKASAAATIGEVSRVDLAMHQLSNR